jgi:two-component system response regulator AtoC
VVLLVSLSSAAVRLTIGGREREGVDLSLNDDRVSKHHAVLTCTESICELMDLGSRNGTRLDGSELAPHCAARVIDGSVLRMGDTVLVPRRGAEYTDLEDSLRELLPGRAPAMFAARALLRALATETGPVLILGETGTGKEYAAQALRAPGKPFLPVNCAELSPGLARAELFGSERGAFTDAATRPGLIGLANGGVLFLDEIGDLDVGVQAELLRFMEDGQYRRVGGTEQLKSTARVVAATNVDLDAAVSRGRFRRDLLGRLRRASRPVVLPPLRERREDIPEWAQRFLREAGVDATFSAGFTEVLLLHPWAENLRELSGTVRSAAREAHEGIIRRKHWPAAPSEIAPAELSRPQAGTKPAYQELDRETLEVLLVNTGGNVREIVRMTGVERTKLYRLFGEWNLEPKRFRPDRRTTRRPPRRTER